ncbi:Leucine-rich repeat receptor protein kinase MSL1 [Capsicum baccatum]|uniref:Leucine-rich repeat receptor protein kinase MSL1 n=1 Tax=Capsicum baccatum TaxID=33114 RepID=A0A2G2VA98_CAPBA|nr:Leucine-rich repeat receptor protein kinase MSL1 [Capsicum baccatum]
MFRGDPGASYAKLPSYLFILQQTNPGSIVILQKLEEGNFIYAFAALNSLIKGWKYCIPVVIVDGSFLKACYTGTFLITSCQDAGGDILPIAYAIVDSENNASWEWFFERDIKSSNILLGRNFKPKVSDFVLAQIISAYESYVSTILAGKFGFISPEYEQTMRAATKGEIYSFGVVMLELVTGRALTRQANVEGDNLVGWVKWIVANGKKIETLDSFFSSSKLWKDQMMHVLAIARLCTNDEP